MAVVEATTPMTMEQLLALPDDGVERWLIRGQLREKLMTYRNRWHSRIMVRVARFLDVSCRNCPANRICPASASPSPSCSLESIAMPRPNWGRREQEK
jgi:ribosomal protein S27E